MVVTLRLYSCLICELDLQTKTTQHSHMRRTDLAQRLHMSPELPWSVPDASTYPQCFMLSGLSILQATFIFKSWSAQFFGTVILCHSGTFDDTGVGLNTTFPISLSSRASMPWFSVNSLILTAGKGCVVEKSPWVSHLETNIVLTVYEIFSEPRVQSWKYLHRLWGFRLISL